MDLLAKGKVKNDIVLQFICVLLPLQFFQSHFPRVLLSGYESHILWIHSLQLEHFIASQASFFGIQGLVQNSPAVAVNPHFFLI